MKKLSLFMATLLASLSALAQEWGVVNISVCNLRDTPTYSAEMVSQALLGTPVHILQTGGSYNWPQVQTPDTYTGWVHKDAITVMDYEAYHAWNVAPKVVVTALTGIVHKEASMQSATVSDVVAGDMLRYLGKRGNYFKVAFPDGRTGYLSRKLAKEEDDWRKDISLSPLIRVKSVFLARFYNQLYSETDWDHFTGMYLSHLSDNVRNALHRGSSTYEWSQLKIGKDESLKFKTDDITYDRDNWFVVHPKNSDNLKARIQLKVIDNNLVITGLVVPTK
jgi:uncharacterized protein YgiM (DUF1202 family)